MFNSYVELPEGTNFYLPPSGYSTLFNIAMENGPCIDDKIDDL